MTENTPHLTPPDAGSNRNEQKKRPSALIILLILFLLFDAAILVFWLLPAKERKLPTVQKTVQAEAPATPGQVTATTRKDGSTAKARQAAEEQLERWLRLEAGDESENINVWGGEAYKEITDLVSRGDQAMAGKDFAGAQLIYLQAIERLQGLLAAKNEKFSTAMDQGYAALEKQDGAAAARNFQLALSMEPDSEDARHGLQRAENLDRVLLFYRQGLELEKKGSLDKARPLLRQAARLDPEFSPAAEALARVEATLKDKAFQRAMSDFFTALHTNDFTRARSSLQKAAAVKPGDPGVRDAEKQLKTTVTSARLSALEKEFYRLAAAEQWQKALQVCNQARRINPDVGFAVQNSDLAKQRAELDQKISLILSRPQRLQDDGPLAEAGQVLNLARSTRNPGPKLSAQIASLTRLIARAGTRVAVKLKSDGATDVVIYKVGRLGTFVEKQLELRPGTYTVVGSRSGFRDVRRQLVVRADRQNSLSIRCEEPI